MKKSLLNIFALFFLFGITNLYAQISVTLPDTTGVVGNTINVPVKLFGANSSANQPVLGIDLNISYIPANLVYSGVTNFYSETPQAQWTINNLTGLLKTVWIEPSYVNALEIPDGTVLFEIVFTYMGGTSPLQFTKHDFINQYLENIESVATDGSVGSGAKTLNVTVFLEGLYAGGMAMNKAQDENGDKWPGDVADKVSIVLHDQTDGSIVYSATDVDLSTSGLVSIAIPSEHSGSYYIAVTQRNHIETWSGAAVDFSGTTIDYDFTTTSLQAYGDNMKDLGEGVYGLYAGDVNQDWFCDSSDLDEEFNDSSIGSQGYIPTDVTGDSWADSSDLDMIFNNSSVGVQAVLPF